MGRKNRFLDNLQTILSKSRVITVLAVKIRNQCNRIIIERYAIKDMSPELNGEYLLLYHIIPVCYSYFDVGANKGEWTSYILGEAKEDNLKIYLYEPGIVAYSMISNRYEGFANIEINNIALSDSVGTLDFYEQDNAGELSSAIEKWAYGPKSKIEVTTTTVDAELARLKIDYLDYLKIDTEGFDLKVLKGAVNSIINNKIGFIQFEYNTAWSALGATLLNAYELLEENGYTVFLIRPTGLYDYQVREMGEFYAFSNFIAVLPQNLIHVKHIIGGLA